MYELLSLSYNIYTSMADVTVSTLCCRAPRPADEVSGAQGKLIRLVEDQLIQGEFPLDIERLRNQFTVADRLHRDSLSHGEVGCCQFMVTCQDVVPKLQASLFAYRLLAFHRLLLVVLLTRSYLCVFTA